MTKHPAKFTITKRVAKHGKQAIIIIPAMLQAQLKPGTLLEINLRILLENFERGFN